MLVASAILRSWGVMRRVTTGASFNAFGECDAVTTTGFSSTESRIVVCATTLIAGTAQAMLATSVRMNMFVERSFTTIYPCCR